MKNYVIKDGKARINKKNNKIVINEVKSIITYFPLKIQDFMT
jgi:hypothetical protein